MTKNGTARGAAVLLCIGCAACDGPQSALDPAGVEAERLAELFFALTAGALAIWTATAGLALYAAFARRKLSARLSGAWLIVGGGVVLPTIVLAGTLSYSLVLLRPAAPSLDASDLRIEVIGEQWWWRVRYLPASGSPVDLANELRLPLGKSIELELASDDVIHSLWVPPLGGKVDMIPGRRTRLVLQPSATGAYRGVCAEYCGASHARMAFRVVVHEEQEFEEWLARQAAPAAVPGNELAAAGADAFFANGCGACHAVRGTPADGTVGPDLTHAGSRLSLAAGMLPNDPDGFRRWLSLTDELKPGVHMPAFGMLQDAEIGALAAYLEGLQ